MEKRTVEDRLREEYFDLLPEIRIVAEELDATVRHALLPIARGLQRHERMVVNSRIKSCESAIEKLRRQQLSRRFEPAKIESYSLRALKDLTAARVMVFPRVHVDAVDEVLRRDSFKHWELDPFREGRELGFKYVGYCTANSRIRCEYQILPLLVGLFWEVEHTAIYKPSPELSGLARSFEIQEKTDGVLRALQDFEDEFLRQLEQGNVS